MAKNYTVVSAWMIELNFHTMRCHTGFSHM